MMSVDEALETLKKFSERVQAYYSLGLRMDLRVDDDKAIEAIEVAIAALEEKVGG